VATFAGTAREVVHLDEEPPLEIYEECLLRTMTVGGLVMLTMTPLLGMTPMVAHFLEDEGNPAKGVVRAGWGDAPHLGEDVKAGLRASLRPHETQAREHGVPQLGRGAVYPVPEEDIVCARFDIPPAWPRCCGVDFGWVNPTAAVWMAHDKEKDIVYVYDVYEKSEATPAEHAAALLARGDIPLVGDPAGLAASARDGQSLMTLYEASGVRISPAENAVEVGLMTALERMRSGRLRVFGDLEAWWAEFRTYRRDGRGKVMKRRDHLMDATRYALVSGLEVARPLVKTPWVRPVVDWRVV